MKHFQFVFIDMEKGGRGEREGGEGGGRADNKKQQQQTKNTHQKPHNTHNFVWSYSNCWKHVMKRMPYPVFT